MALGQKIITIDHNQHWILRWSLNYPDFHCVWVDRMISLDRFEDHGSAWVDGRIPEGIPSRVKSAIGRIFKTSTATH